MASCNITPTDSLDSHSFSEHAKNVELTIDSFGYMDGDKVESKKVTRFTWSTKNNMKVQVITYGATITSIKVPDKYDNVVDIVLGFENMEGYQQSANPYFGATVGRVANRTAGASFVLNEKEYTISNNKDGNHLHGGFKGFDKVNWDYHVEGTKVFLSYLSKDGEEGYPGNLLTQVMYDVTSDNIIKMKMECMSTKPTPVNLTNHSYFNLAGHDAGAKEMYNHVITINADKYTPTNQNLVTTGQIVSVGDSLFDFRVPRLIQEMISKIPGNAYDTNFCVTQDSEKSLTFVSRVVYPKTGRVMEIYSNQPGVQFYTSNFLPNPNEKPLIGKNGTSYNRHGAFCLETQNLPNAVNYKHFPNAILNPGKKYIHDVEYRFSIQV